ncbi:MAG: polyprenyl synthetase family protein [Patescibacteria group bacterium]|nr:polyprenyl synthetase family protein [Patescibacteria group bacterium]MBU1877227.1 polyprenyl synthetase family protein [Patescibacteria group bacterium]
MPDNQDSKSKEFIEYLESKKPEIDKIIEKYLPRKATQEWLKFVFGDPRYTYSPDAADAVFMKPIWNFIDRGGKRWRPVLFLLIVEAVGGDLEKVQDIVMIPEIIHNGSIIVDDIEDMGELRRNEPCLHKVFGVDVAINAGNFMYFYPLLALIKNKDNFTCVILQKAYETYAQEMINIHLGQGTDIFWHNGKAVNIEEDEYLQMCAYKTGCLSRMSAKLAVILSGGSDQVVEAAGRVAETMGVAFQIQDDILDIISEGEERDKFGKVFGNDIKEGKRTLMVIHTLKKASDEDKARLIGILDKHTDDIKEKEEAIAIIKKYGSVEYAQTKAKEIMGDAWQEAEKLLPESPAKKRLEEFVNFLITRKI